MKTNIICLLGLLLIIIFLLINNNESFITEIEYELPKRIWSFWDTTVLPSNIQAIVDYNSIHMKGWEYIILNEFTIYDYIDKETLPTKFKRLSPEHKSDWIRLALLKQYGGLWMDITIIMNRSFDDIYNESCTLKSMLTGFQLRGDYTKYKNNKYIENWFIMAPKNSNIISLWYTEFNTAINMGFLSYKYRIIKDGVDVSKIYDKNDTNVYLTQHACLQKILQKDISDNVSMLFYNSIETMFKIQEECKWNTECIHEYVKDPQRMKKIPYIKLVGSQRKGLNFNDIFSINKIYNGPIFIEDY